MMAIPTHKMLWLTIVLAGLAVLVAGDEMNKTSTASPKVQASMAPVTKTMTSTTTTQPPPPLTAVMDLFQAPLAAFKPKMEDEGDMPMGRDDQSAPVTPAPSNIFFRAGNGLGSAASSLTGWFNNRMIPQALRPASSTTPAPSPVFQIVPSQQIRRKVVVNRQKPVVDDLDDLEENEEGVINDDDDDEESFNLNNDMVEDDDEDDYEPVGKRKNSKQTQKRPNKQYFYIEEELAENDDLDYDVQQLPVRKTQRKQQNLSNKRRKTTPKKKQQKRRKPVRKVQKPKPQRVQYVLNQPSKTQVKRKRRPTATFELVPISPNQAITSIQKKQPASSTQNSQQRPMSQFLSIPWSRLGLAGPPKESTSNEQQSKPIIVRIPQQNIKRKRRPAKKPAKTVTQQKRKPNRGQLMQNQSPVFSVLNEEQIREIFKNQLNKPSNTTPQTSSNLPVTLDHKKKPTKQESQEVPSKNDDSEPEEKPQAQAESGNHEEDTDSFIVVGAPDDDDDKEIDTNLYRHYNNRRAFKGRRASVALSQDWEMDDEYDE